MADSLVDLDQPGLVLPRQIVLDSSLLVARWLGATRPPRPHQAARVADFFLRLRASNSIGFIPSVGLHETLHIALVAEYRQALPHHRADLIAALPRKRRFDWDDLYKVRPDLIARFRPALAGFRLFLAQHRLVVLQPTDLSPLPAGQLLEMILLETIVHYQLDTSDAAILLEAQRAGITAIATLDADLRRATIDFDVYTWI